MTQIDNETLARTVAAFNENDKNQRATALSLGLARSTVQLHLRRAAERGLLGTEPVLDGFAIKSISSKDPESGAWVRQGRAPGEVFAAPETHVLGKMTVQRDPEGRVVQDWVRYNPDAQAQAAAMAAVASGLKDALPRAETVSPPAQSTASLLNLYVLTDAHLGALAWSEETGSSDYDLTIAEKLIDDWFAAAVELAPPSGTAILAQLGDMLHWDGFESVTPTNRHVLDGDSRFDKMVRVAIRLIRKIVRRLLAKHDRVHLVMADANHDPASGSWLRGWLAAHYEDEPRITVDDSAGTYYAYRHGNVSLFLHHGHRRKIGDVDSVFAGRYREIYGATKYSFAHLGHLHSDELKTTNLMKVERHETLAAPDAYAANGGWLSGRSAKVITYSAEHGEVARLTLTPGMVAGWASAANDNNALKEAA